MNTKQTYIKAVAKDIRTLSRSKHPADLSAISNMRRELKRIKENSSYRPWAMFEHSVDRHFNYK